jgi:predicted F0F1-ATPase subunit
MSMRPDLRRSLERDARRLARRDPKHRAFWRSLSVLGTVGWSIAGLAALGAWFGRRLDLRFETGVHFTLVLLFGGVLLGSAIAWSILRDRRR